MRGWSNEASAQAELPRRTLLRSPSVHPAGTRVRPTALRRDSAAILALQRTAGNRAATALLARQAGDDTATAAGAMVSDFETLLSGGSSQMPPARNPAGGCAVCSRPAEAGKLAHALVQGLAVAGAGSRMIPELMLVAGPEDADPELGNGRLDLALSTGQGFGIEIGEIKPYNLRGLRAGRKDLDFYLNWVRTNRPGTPVGFMQDWPGPNTILFIDPRTKLCAQQLEVIPATDGLFFYRCTPNAATVRGLVSGCDCEDPEPDPQQQSTPAIDAAKAAAITAGVAAAAKAAIEAAKEAPKGVPAPGGGMGPMIVPKFFFKDCFLRTMDPSCTDTTA